MLLRSTDEVYHEFVEQQRAIREEKARENAVIKEEYMITLSCPKCDRTHARLVKHDPINDPKTMRVGCA